MSVKLITSSTTITTLCDYYIVIPSSSITITLSLITCDGIRFVISRKDSDDSKVVTVSTVGSNLISISSTVYSSTYDISINSTIEIVSYTSNWMLTGSFSNINTYLGSLASGILITGDVYHWIVCSGNNSGTSSTVGSIGIIEGTIINSVTVSIYNISAGTLSGKIVIEGISYTVIEVIISNIQAGFTSYTDNTLINIPSNVNHYYSINWYPDIGTLNNQKIGISSIMIA